ncbi:MAG TPA: hypothetical protein VII56_00320 [Rhizomicrobium sp.]
MCCNFAQKGQSACGAELFVPFGDYQPDFHTRTTMRSGLLWLIGVPIPIIIILWLVTGHA